MGKFIDLTGWVMSEHGVSDSRLTVIKRGPSVIVSGKPVVQWWCRCSCGRHDDLILIAGGSLRSGNTKSCGCINKEIIDILHMQSCKENPVDLSGEYGIGWTINTNKEFYFDLKNYDKIKDFCWCDVITKGNFHRLIARDKTSGKPITMHALLGFKNYDHKDRNEFNNLESNLRPCTQKENSRNSSIRRNNASGVTGVYLDKQTMKWRANITVDGKTIHLGRFANKQDAIHARLIAEKEHFGEFAPQQHLFEEFNIIEEELEYAN